MIFKLSTSGDFYFDIHKIKKLLKIGFEFEFDPSMHEYKKKFSWPIKDKNL